MVLSSKKITENSTLIKLHAFQKSLNKSTFYISFWGNKKIIFNSEAVSAHELITLFFKNFINEIPEFDNKEDYTFFADHVVTCLKSLKCSYDDWSHVNFLVKIIFFALNSIFPNLFSYNSTIEKLDSHIHILKHSEYLESNYLDNSVDKIYNQIESLLSLFNRTNSPSQYFQSFPLIEYRKIQLIEYRKIQSAEKTFHNGTKDLLVTFNEEKIITNITFESPCENVIAEKMITGDKDSLRFRNYNFLYFLDLLPIEQVEPFHLFSLYQRLSFVPQGLYALKEHLIKNDMLSLIKKDENNFMTFVTILKRIQTHVDELELNFPDFISRLKLDDYQEELIQLKIIKRESLKLKTLPSSDTNLKDL